MSRADALADVLPFVVPQPTAEQLAAAERDHRARNDREHRERADARLAALRALNAPERILRDLARVHDTEPVRALGRALAVGPGCIVVLAGGPGIGKTTAALHWLACADGRPWFATARQWAASPPWSHDWKLARAAVLDDLGTEDDVRFRGRFDELVAHFHAQLRDLVITTNLPGEAFKARYGGRVTSRIREAGAFLALTGPDLRAKRSGD